MTNDLIVTLFKETVTTNEMNNNFFLGQKLVTS